MGIYSLLTLGSTVVGGPFVGWVCQHWNPRVGIGLAGAATVLAAIALVALSRARSVEIAVDPAAVEAAVEVA